MLVSYSIEFPLLNTILIIKRLSYLSNAFILVGRGFIFLNV